MPINSFLPDRRIDPETKWIMSLAFEVATAAFYNSGQRVEPADIANAVIASAESDANQICEVVLTKLGHVPPRLGNLNS
jgi:hypothetical protein